MKGYVLDYVNENEFRKLERALKKYNMIAFKKLNFEYYPAIRNGEFLGELVSTDKKAGTKTYELRLPSDKLFTQIHGEVKLIYEVHEKEKVAILETLTPESILLEGHRSELTTYKGKLTPEFKHEIQNFVDKWNIKKEVNVSFVKYG